MPNISKKTALALILVLIAIGLMGRLLPHAANFTPLTAIMLFASAYLGLRYALLIFLPVMIVSDIYLGFYEWQIMLVVYLGFIVAGLIGLMIAKNRSALKIFAGALSSSIIFFILSNLAVWQWSGMYPHTLEGLIECFTLAIPFFKNSLIGDLLYTGVLFGIFESAFRYLAEKQKAKNKVLQNI